jgi:hypothetical protein
MEVAEIRGLLEVHIDGTAGPYVLVPVTLLPALEAALKLKRVLYWVDADAISVDGKPEIAIVNFGRSVDGNQIQQLIDSLK